MEVIIEKEIIEMDKVVTQDGGIHPLYFNGLSNKIEVLNLPENIEFFLMTPLFRTVESKQGILEMDGNVRLIYGPDDERKLDNIDLKKLTNDLRNLNDNEKQLLNDKQFINLSRINLIYIVFIKKTPKEIDYTNIPQKLSIINHRYNLKYLNGNIKMCY